MIKIYYASASGISLETCEPISGYRRKRLSETQDEKRKRVGLAAELLLIKALKDLMPGLALPAKIVCGKNDRPELEGVPLHFSLSHTGEFAACAISDVPVGLDIQIREAPRDNILRRVFSPEEREYVLADAQPAFAFTKLWTMKESVVKLSGEGIGAMLSGINVLGMPWIWHEEIEGVHFALCCGPDRMPHPELYKIQL